MVQAEAQNQEEAFDLDILNSPSGSKLQTRSFVPVGKIIGEKAVFYCISYWKRF